MTNITLFSQIISKIDRQSFNGLVKEYKTDQYQKGISSWSHLVSMLFCQFSKSNSLRDISNGLRSATGNLNHLGMRSAPSKSGLSYQNCHRDYRLFQAFYYQLLDDLMQRGRFKQNTFKIKSKIYLLDSSSISLCLSLFDWAKYKTTKGAIKLHTLLDYDGHLPSYVHISDGKVTDNTAAASMPIRERSVVVADLIYQDFALLYKWDSIGAFFVVRSKSNLQYTSVKENELPDNRHQHILIDEVIELEGNITAKKYPKRLRRIAVYDAKEDRVIELLSNNFIWTANTISELYKARWQIEIFFKEIKQLLKIKSFLGTSENAVMIQVWTAMITILMLKYLRKIARHTWNLSNLVAFLRLNLFVKIDLHRWLDAPFEQDVGNTLIIQGTLF
jgi:hypothetical protein